MNDFSFGEGIFENLPPLDTRANISDRILLLNS